MHAISKYMYAWNWSFKHTPSLQENTNKQTNTHIHTYTQTYACMYILTFMYVIYHNSSQQPDVLFSEWGRFRNHGTHYIVRHHGRGCPISHLYVYTYVWMCDVEICRFESWRSNINLNLDSVFMYVCIHVCMYQFLCLRRLYTLPDRESSIRAFCRSRSTYLLRLYLYLQTCTITPQYLHTYIHTYIHACIVVSFQWDINLYTLTYTYKI